jgi:hypothetical protein
MRPINSLETAARPPGPSRRIFQKIDGCHGRESLAMPKFQNRSITFLRSSKNLRGDRGTEVFTHSIETEAQ